MNDHSDILIIGGGVAGLTAAAALAPFGSTRLLEREPALAYHASGRSAAMFLENYGNAVVKSLNKASTAAHQAMGVLSPRPMMLIGTPEHADRFEAERLDFGLTRIGLDEAEKLFPILDPSVTSHAALRADAQELDTDLLIQAARKTARAADAEILTGAEVTAITHDKRWRVSCADRVYEADVLVNAGGAWADVLAQMAGVAPLGIQPYRRSMAVLPLPEGMDGAGWAFTDAVGEAWYAKAQAGKLLVSPSEEDPMPPMDAWPDDMVIAEGLARFEAMCRYEVTRLEHSWAGLRSFAPDRTLVVGRDARVPSFIWAAGQGGYGFQTAPAVAQLLADLAQGRPSALPAETVSALDPARFG